MRVEAVARLDALVEPFHRVAPLVGDHAAFARARSRARHGRAAGERDLGFVRQGTKGHARHIDRDIEHHRSLGARADDGLGVAFLAIAFDDEAGERARQEGQVIPMRDFLEQREAAHAVAAELRLDVDVVHDLRCEDLGRAQEILLALGRRPREGGKAGRGALHRAIAVGLGGDVDGLHAHLRLRPAQVHMQQAVVEPGALDLDPLGQHEGALELARRDAAVQEVAALAVVLVAPANHQLVVLLRDLQVVHAEARDGERDAEPGFAGLLDVVGRVAVGVLGDPFEHLLEMIEAEEQGRAEHGLPGHQASSFRSEAMDGARSTPSAQ